MSYNPLEIESPLFEILLFACGVIFLAALANMPVEDQSWVQITREEAETSSYPTRTAVGMRGDMQHWKKVQ